MKKTTNIAMTQRGFNSRHGLRKDYRFRALNIANIVTIFTESNTEITVWYMVMLRQYITAISMMRKNVASKIFYYGWN